MQNRYFVFFCHIYLSSLNLTFYIISYQKYFFSHVQASPDVIKDEKVKSDSNENESEKVSI